MQTEDDPVHVENSLLYFKALKDAKVEGGVAHFRLGWLWVWNASDCTTCFALAGLGGDLVPYDPPV